MSESPRLVLYARAGCHLCDEARDALVPLAAAAGIDVTEVDIESNDDLHRQYLERIPVIELDGIEISEQIPDPIALRRHLSPYLTS